MKEQSTNQTGIKNIFLGTLGVLTAIFYVILGQPVTQAEEVEGSSKSETEFVSVETQSVYIDANVTSDYGAKETKVSGETVAGAEVTVTYPNEEVFTGEADKNGKFVFDELPELENGDEVKVEADKDDQLYEIVFNYQGTGPV